eukprot:CAMPEP_0168759778 /NCGR_PEP_ID=MMETSP0724-20121128/22411_1 /TAXON_ID=265536 /ORGANISM="Amphiprora sp., Strain CCMP467" /LENGTH=68 /DNA_ID=CAMNT_0008808737 /DNA_START=16 /DNA_END=219 /DNA_ORIENTATION=+
MTLACAARKVWIDVAKISGGNKRMVAQTNPDPALTSKLLSTTARQAVAEVSDHVLGTQGHQQGLAQNG